MYEDLNHFIKFLVVVSFITVPLGIWKLVDIIVWIARHVNVSIGLV